MKIWRPIIFLIVFGLIIALFILWIVSIISFFFALPFGRFIIPGPSIISVIGLINLIILVGVPVLLVLLRGIKFLFHTNVMTTRLKVGMWSVWSLNLISLFALASITGSQFSAGEVESQNITIQAAESDTLHLHLQDNHHINSFINFANLELDNNKLYAEEVELSILRSKSGAYELEMRKHSRGKNMEEATLLANEIAFAIEQSGHELIIPKTFVIKENGKYRGQSVELILRVPDGKYLKIDKEINRILGTVDVHEASIAPWHQSDKVWKMGTEGLICVACPESKVGDEKYDFKDFSKLQIDGKMKIEINKSDEFKVHLTGKEVYTRKVDLVQTKDNLTISADLEDPNSPVRLYIDMPSLSSLQLDGTDDVKISGFVQQTMNIKSESDDDLKAYINVDSLQLTLKGRTEFDIRGSGKYLKATLHDKSSLDAEHYTVDLADITTNNYSRASVAVVDTLRQQIFGDSRISVDGDPRIVIDSQQ